MKAALVLLPLLGANQILGITGPFSTSPVHLGLWSFASFALTGFQGLIFSLLYCFCNSDVRSTAPPPPRTLGRLSLASLRGSLNRVPASAGVWAGMSALPGGR